MTMNSVRNHPASTPIRIPNTSASLIEPGRRNMLQWWHRCRNRFCECHPPPFGANDLSNHLQLLRTRLGELEDLRNAAGLLGWDQQTMMPPRGGPARAESLATLERISHELFVSDDTGRLLEAAATALDGVP